MARCMARRRIDLQLAVDATVKKSGPFDAAAISERKTIAGKMVETSMMTLPGYLGVGEGREELGRSRAAGVESCCCRWPHRVVGVIPLFLEGDNL